MEQTPPAKPTAAPSSSPAPAAGSQYASFGQRFLAALIDGVVIIIANSVIGLIWGFVFALSRPTTLTPGVAAPTTLALSGFLQLINLVIGFGYYVYFIGSRGQTLGKMALNIKVVKMDSRQIPNYTEAFLREVVGKIISGIALFIGYLWMLWDKDKQTWHDKIAKTVVIKVK